MKRPETQRAESHNPAAKPLDIALRLLARREHSAAELAQKLRQRGCEERAISATLTTLAERGWQSDERYARGAVEGRARRGFGPRRIRQGLHVAGVDNELTQRELQSADIDWETSIDALSRKYLKTKDQNDRAVQLKLMAHLLRRGYSTEQIRAALKRVLKTPL